MTRTSSNAGYTTTASFCFDVDFKPLAVDRKLAGETGTFALGPVDLSWIHTPGHTPGSISLFMDVEGERILLPRTSVHPCSQNSTVIRRHGLSPYRSRPCKLMCSADGHPGAFGLRRISSGSILSTASPRSINKATSPPGNDWFAFCPHCAPPFGQFPDFHRPPSRAKVLHCLPENIMTADELRTTTRLMLLREQ